jgi:hypothetical protein
MRSAIVCAHLHRHAGIFCQRREAGIRMFRVDTIAHALAALIHSAVMRINIRSGSPLSARRKSPEVAMVNPAIQSSDSEKSTSLRIAETIRKKLKCEASFPE